MPPSSGGGGGGGGDKPKPKLEDFEMGKLLGRGAFGKVRLAVHKASGDKFAMKTLNKSMLVQAKQVTGALTEKEVLRQSGHPCIVRLYHAFQDATSLHMLLDYCPGGDLYDRIEEEGTVSLERARLYAAEITLGLGHLHDTLDIIYRDIKPENVLLDAMGHALLTDFGLVVKSGSRKAFCGSTEYIAPEVVRLRTERKGEHDKAVDWWGLGVMLYEMLCGGTPFADESHDVILDRISSAEITTPDSMDPAASALVLRLLDRDPSRRLGAGATGTKDVKAHPFWQPISFDDVLARRIAPGWAPPAVADTPAPDTAAADMAAADASAAASAGAGDESDSFVDDSDDDFDESEDEWHKPAPGAQAEPDPQVQALFRGFTFHRRSSFMPSAKEGQLTRAQSVLQKRRSTQRAPSTTAEDSKGKAV